MGLGSENRAWGLQKGVYLKHRFDKKIYLFAERGNLM
jgi:hypothetical protein